MKELVCKICNKQYKTIQSLCNHNTRFHKNTTIISLTSNVMTEMSNVMTKTPNVMTEMSNIIDIVVEKTTTYFCKYCNYEFKKRQNKWAHEKKYCKKKSEIINKKPNTAIIYNTHISNIINNNTNNGTINNNNTINNYMNDNIEYISDAFIKKMFNHLKNVKTHIIPIPRMIENIKFNPSHKENNNVKITNIRSKVAMIYDNNKWLTVDKKELLDELYIFATNLFKNWAEMKDFITEEMKTNYKNFSKHSQIVLTKDFLEEINRKAYIYTKNNENSL